MAARFWIGGAGNWSDTTHWSTTSGGAGGSAVPTSSDDVTLDANSGAGIITVDIAASASTLTASAYTGGITLTAGLTVIGNVVLPTAAPTIAGTGIFTMQPTAAQTSTVTANGTVFTGGFAISGAATGTVSLLDRLTVNSTVTLNSGIFKFNNNSHIFNRIDLSPAGASARTFNPGLAGALTISNSSNNAFNASDATNLTISSNGASIFFTGGGGISVATGINWNGMSILWSGGGTQMGIYGSNGNIFKNIQVNGANKTDVFSFSNSHTFTGTQCQFQGVSQSTRTLVKTNSGAGSGGPAASITITNNGAWGANQYVDFQDINIAGTAGSLTGTLIGDAGGNTGITFTASAQQTWQGTSGGNWSDGTKWTSRVPLPQDDVIINAAFIASQTITADMPRLARSIDFTGVSGNPNFSHTSIITAIFGSLTLATGMTHSSGQHFQLKGRGAFTLTSAGKGWGFDIDIIAPGGTYTLLDDLPGNAEILHITGTFDANNHNVTISDFITTGTLTRTVNMGTGTWTLSGAATVWQAAATGLTFNKSTSVIAVSDTSGSAKTFVGGGLSYSTLRFTPTGGGTLNITGNNTFVNLDVEYSSGASVTTTGNEITDTNRLAALSWGTNQQGGSTDGLGLYENRVTNPSFEIDTSGWNPGGTGATITRDNAHSHDGAWSCKVQTTGNANSGLAMNSTTQVVPGLAGSIYTASCWLFSVAGGEQVYVALNWLDSSQASLSSSLQNVTLVPGWQRVILTATAPASSVYAIIRIQTQGASSYTWWADSIMVEAGSTAHTYVDLFGVSTPNGYGIYAPGINLFKRGQCDALGTNDWIAATTATLSLDTTLKAPFSPQRVQVVTQGLAAQEGVFATTAAGLGAVAGTLAANGVGSIYFKGVAGQNYLVWLRWRNTDATSNDGTASIITATGAWQLATPALFAVQATKTGDQLQIMCRTQTQRAETFWVAHAMLQQGVSVVSPYIATSAGATATRNGGTIQAPVGVLNASQMWWAILYRAGWAAASRTDFPEFFEWRTDANNRLQLLYNGPSSKMTQDTRVASVPSDVNSAVQTFNIGDLVLTIGKVSTSQIGISQGGAFTNASNTQFLTPTGTLFAIGSALATFGAQSDGAVVWAAAGIGIPSTTDAATLSGLGTTAPSINTLPASAGLTFVWNALGTSYFPGRILTLPAGGTQTITGLLTFAGISGQQLSVMSATPGTSSTIQMASGSSISFNNQFLSSDIILKQAKLGGGIIHTLGGASERKLTVETGGGKTKTFTGATEKSSHIERGGGLTKLFTGATERKLYVKSSGVISKTVAGARMFAYSISVGGAKTKAYSGATSKGLAVHAGGAVVKTVVGSTENLKFVEVSGGILASVSGGGELFVGMHHGGTALTMRAGGFLRIVRVSGDKDFLLESSIDRPVLIGARIK